MLARISSSEMSRILSIALKEGILGEEDTAAVFYDLSRLSLRLTELRKAFPTETLHSIAVKANPLLKILKIISALGFGLEAASMPELQLAELAGVSTDKIVFDSPVKTLNEIKYALNLGAHLNIDNLFELERISQLLMTSNSKSSVGLRINPQVGRGRIASTSVAEEYSKFGVPIGSQREKIIDAFLKNDWLNGVHVHIGSQGVNTNQLVNAVRTVLDLCLEVNIRKAKHNRIKIFDIGGGLSVPYSRADPAMEIAKYGALLRERCPAPMPIPSPGHPPTIQPQPRRRRRQWWSVPIFPRRFWTLSPSICPSFRSNRSLPSLPNPASGGAQVPGGAVG